YVGYTPHLTAIQTGRQFDEEQKARKRQERKAQQATTDEQEEQAHIQAIEQAMFTESAMPEEEPTQAEATGIILGAAKLWRDPRTKQWYVLVTLAMPVPDVTPEHLPTTTGIDLGQRYLAVSTTATNRTQFMTGGQAVHKGEAYARVRQRLQKKGTSGARWRLRQMTLKERRFK